MGMAVVIIAPACLRYDNSKAVEAGQVCGQLQTASRSWADTEEIVSPEVIAPLTTAARMSAPKVKA